MTNLVTALTKVTEDQRAAILASERTAAQHQDLLSALPAMSELEVGGEGRLETLPADFTVAAWNVERCLFPERSAAHVHQHKPSIVLLSEMDKGMARTGQRNTTAEMAKALGMHYAFGVEFFEMGLGGPTERVFCHDDFNAEGWHGNGIL